MMRGSKGTGTMRVMETVLGREVVEGQVVEEDVLVAAAGHRDLGAAGVRAGVLGLLPRLVAVQPLKWTETV